MAVLGPARHARFATARAADPAAEWTPYWEYGCFIDVRDVASAVLAGLATFVVLAMEVGGFRRLEAAITALVGVVLLAFCLEILMSRPSPSAVASGAFEPRLPGGAALLAVSIVGATVMPHVIYLHSALVRDRVDSATAEKRRRRSSK